MPEEKWHSPSKCAYCEEERDELWACEQCGDMICEDCTADYNQFTMIDFTLCMGCEITAESERQASYEREEKRRLGIKNLWDHLREA
jgi:hypothetical protein